MANRNRRKRRRGCSGRIFVILLVISLLAGGWHIVSGMHEYDVNELIEMGYPESLAKLYARNEEARDFVLDYDERSCVSDIIDVSGDVVDGEIPLFIQWDKRWGYGKYGDDFMAVVGCGPSSLSMVYCGLTGDTDMNPWEVAKLAEERGYYVSGQGSSWSMMDELAVEMGLTVRNVYFDKYSILNEISAGHPIICIVGPGDFTTEGHFIVLTGVDENGKVIVNDPNSRINSGKRWDIETIMSQTRNLWGYEFS